MRLRSLWILFIVGALAACSGSNIDAGGSGDRLLPDGFLPDGFVDGEGDADPDVPGDGDPDVVPDSVPDADPDALPDASPDVLPDVPVDDDVLVDADADIDQPEIPPGDVVDETDGCTPNCEGRVCGDDGCQGSCGECGSPQVCSDAGQCVAPDTPTTCDEAHGLVGCCFRRSLLGSHLDGLRGLACAFTDSSDRVGDMPS